MNNETRLILADDHPLLRHGLRRMIEKDPHLTVLAEADDGAEALRLIQTLKPDIAVLDVHMPELTGFDVARAVGEQRLPTAIIILTMFKEEEMFNTALNLGIKGYVLKDGALTEIAACIKSVAAGQSFISSALSHYALDRRRRTETLLTETPGLNALTPTERRVLRLVANHKSSKEIAEELNIHYRTVDNHRTNISQKLGLHGTHALVKFALEHKSELGTDPATRA